MKKLSCLLLVFLCALPLFSLDVEQYEDQLNLLSSRIKEGLTRSQTKIESLSESLTALRNDLTVSESRRTELETIYNEACTSLESMSKLLQNYSETIEKYKDQARARNKIIFIIGVICTAFIALKAAAIIARVKFGVKMPWIIDVLV
jgi:t-SNARE complex subunit (syntaxin)